MAPAATISTRDDLADAIEAAVHLNRLQIGRLAGDLTGVAAGLFNEHIERAPDHFAIERVPLLIEECLQPRQPFRLHGFRDLVFAARPRACRDAAEYLNEKALANSTFSIKSKVASKSSSVSPGKPTMKSDDKAMSGRAARISRDKRDVVGARVLAVHRGEDFVRAGLHRQMQERHQARLIAMRLDETCVHVAWMARRVADAGDAGHLRDPGAEHGERSQRRLPAFRP